MTEPGLRLVIRTPREVVFDGEVRAARVLTETGQVGLRPRGEPLVLGIEPGLVVLRGARGSSFAATAGGLLGSDRERCALFTPFAVAGSSAEAVLAALDQAFAAPDSELAARRRLGELEQHILQEISQRGSRHG